MGLWSFFKGFFTGEDEELEALRRKHNIRAASGGVKEGRASPKTERNVPDPWEEIDNYRMNFFLGSWAARRFRGLGKRKDKEKDKGEGG